MVKRGLAFGGILAILSGVGIYNNIYAATEGSTKFSVDINQAVLELTVPSNPAVIDLNPTMTNASFGSTSINVHVATNNTTGYTLTMTPTNNQEATSLIRTELIEDEEEYREIETLEQTDPISTGYTEETFTANAWGYKITGDNYYGIDPENTTVSHPAWVTSEPTNGTNHNLTLAAKVDADTVSGAYETTLNFRAVTNAVVAKHTLSFNANGGTGTMNDITVTAGNSTTLSANTFTPPTGMKFIGWSTTQNGQGQGVRYYDDEATYTATDIGYNVNLTLYAQWTDENTPTPQGSSSGTTPGTTLQRAYEIAYTAAHKGMYEEDTPGSNTYTYIDSWNGGQYQGNGRDVRFLIQDMTPEICASATALDSEALVLDIRDQTSYHIIKARDGRCWMADNLALDLLDEKTKNNINPTNTNADSMSIYALFNGGRENGGQYPPLAVGAYSQTRYGFLFAYPLIFNNYKNTIPSSTNDPMNDAVVSGGWKIGILYNYCAASAGVYCYGIGTNSYDSSIYHPSIPIDRKGTAIDSEFDVCPYGWRMPTGHGYYTPSMPDGGEVKNLTTSYLAAADTEHYTDFRIRLRIGLSGSFGGSNYEVSYGGEAIFWTSTSRDWGVMYDWSIGNSSNYFSPDRYYGAWAGHTIRCIAK